MGRHWPSKETNSGNAMVFFVPEADKLWGVGNPTSQPGGAGGQVASSSRPSAVTDGDDTRPMQSTMPPSAQRPPPQQPLLDLEVRMPNVTIPENGASIMCTQVVLPHDRKYHIVG